MFSFVWLVSTFIFNMAGAADTKKIREMFDEAMKLAEARILELEKKEKVWTELEQKAKSIVTGAQEKIVFDIGMFSS